MAVFGFSGLSGAQIDIYIDPSLRILRCCGQGLPVAPDIRDSIAVQHIRIQTEVRKVAGNILRVSVPTERMSDASLKMRMPLSSSTTLRSMK